MIHPGDGGGGDHLGELLSAYVDNELTPPEAAAARDHLASCEWCAAELADVSAVRAMVRGLPQLDPPFGFYERILGQGRRAPASRRWGPFVPVPQTVPAAAFVGAGVGGATPAGVWTPRRVGAAAFGAAAAAVVLLGLAPPRDTPVSPPVNSLVEAHATGASFGSDPLSGLAPIGVPITFRR